jgi:hypothetical protein
VVDRGWTAGLHFSKFFQHLKNVAIFCKLLGKKLEEAKNEKNVIQHFKNVDKK